MNKSKNIRNFCIIAHIDHGKSTLADRMLELTKTISERDMKAQLLDTMDLERERGITIKLQPVRMLWESNPKFEALNTKQTIKNNFQKNKLDSVSNFDIRDSNLSDSKYIFNLIDTPGHVDFGYEVSRTLAAVEGAILLVDATQGIQAQTLANLYQAQKQNLDIIPVINKIDMPNADIEGTKKELAELLKIDPATILAISAKTGEGVAQIFTEIINRVKPPVINTDKPLRALIFDSVYDTYRGVVAYVRVVDGKISQNDPIRFMISSATDQALEVGYFSPRYVKSNSLQSGDIGYIVTGLREIKSCNVGDTITEEIRTKDQGSNNVNPLPGYKRIQPMVYAGFYSKDGEVDKLRDALEKLSLNDSSLYFEPENSTVFGFGFRCGFLGLLHLDIIKERLMREYNLDLIITSPKVDYKERIIGGKLQYAEPWVKLEIVSPHMYIGQIIKLTMDIRGKYLDTKYIGDRAVLYFEAPLANIITNFYDKLKSASAGYASLNYEFIDYREEPLEKLDILVAGEKMDTLSQIAHKNEVYNKAQSIVKKLKEFLPRQMFKVTLQAAIGGKIIAREDIPAMKKDVTGHLYGGDISRKQKLWKKQAKGKKKMQKLGKLDIPTDVFIKILQ